MYATLTPEGTGLTDGGGSVGVGGAAVGGLKNGFGPLLAGVAGVEPGASFIMRLKGLVDLSPEGVATECAGGAG